MKSLRNINFENECPIGNIKNDEKNLKYFNNHNEILIHCEEDYENAIKAVSVMFLKYYIFKI